MDDHVTGSRRHRCR